MDEYVVAFDVDGIIRSFREGDEIVPNEFIRSLIITLSKFRNVKVVAHSIRGSVYAQQIVREVGLGSYIKDFYMKGEVVPDIAVDDQHSAKFGKMNLIYNERQAKVKEAW